MSKRGVCYNKAVMESWDISLKVEAIHGQRLKTRKQPKECVIDCIEVHYNRERLHTSLGYASLEQFECEVA
jgi:putative transposase